MTFLDTVTAAEGKVASWFVTTEANVQAVIVLVQKDIAVIEADVDAALKWVANNTPTIVSYVEAVIGFASQVGLSSTPAGAAAVLAAQTAIATLNAVAQAQNTGASDIQTLLAGYAAIKQAQGAASSAAAAATQAVAAKAA